MNSIDVKPKVVKRIEGLQELRLRNEVEMPPPDQPWRPTPTASTRRALQVIGYRFN